MFFTASSYLFLSFVLSALFYKESRILYWLHLTFYFKDSLHATSRSYTKRQCIKIQIYRFMTYRVLCHVTLLLSVAIFFLNVVPSDSNFGFGFLGNFQLFFYCNSENSFKVSPLLHQVSNYIESSASGRFFLPSCGLVFFCLSRQHSFSTVLHIRSFLSLSLTYS